MATTGDDLSKLMEQLTGVPAPQQTRRLSKEERKKQAERVRRFLALPPQLQEGILKYGENIREAYSSKVT